MAKKTPKKYRQAKKAAKPAAKEAFPGKTKAARRDPMAKYSAEDREVFKEITKESKGRYITDDRGNKIQVKPDETAKERIARERREAMRKFREEVDTDKQAASDKRMAEKRQAAMDKQTADRAASKGRRAPGLLQSAPKEKPLSRPVKKAAAKPVAKKAPAKKVGTVGTTRKPDAQGVKKVAEEAKKIQATKKAAVKPSKTFGEISKAVTKPAAAKGMTRAEKSAANKAAWKNMTPAERKEWAKNKPGAKTVYNITTAQPEKAAKGSTPAKFVQKKAVAKKAPAKPATSKAVAVRPKGAVATTAKAAAGKTAKGGLLRGAARLAGKAVTGRVGLAVTAASLLGKPVLEALTKQPAGAKKPTAAETKTSKTRSNQPRLTGQGRFVNAGGATTKIGSSYTVKKGDTFSAIAKNAGVSLAELRAANPAIMKNKKYKQGAVIWSGTKVRIPKK
jgi:LysM repeat protein